MFRIFSIEEANDLIPQVDTVLSDMQTSVNDILRLREEIAAAPTHSIAARNKTQELHFIMQDVQTNKLKLDKLGVFLKDVDTGLVDIPSQVGAEVVCLSWQKGQDSITHYHRLNEGKNLPLEFTQQDHQALA